MRVLYSMCALFLSWPLLADSQYITQIHDIDYGQNLTEEPLVFLSNGQVAKFHPETKRLLEEIHARKSNREYFQFTLNKARQVTSIQPAKAPVGSPGEVLHPPMLMPEKNYVPTTVENMVAAKKLHGEGRRPTKEETQCFNRAMVWTYEWWKNHSLKSQKILIFFTRNYIRRYNFEWWFHIAPYIHVLDNGKVVERVMDMKYTSRPLTFKQWTDVFMQKDPECPVITKYSEYADYPYTGECYIYRTHMYTYQPADLQMYEAWGYTKNSFLSNEVAGAYLEAYDIVLK